MLNRLTLVPGSAPEHQAFFWEPAVDGRLLRTLLGDPGDGLDAEAHTVEPVGRSIPVFVHSWPVPLLDDALVLLGERPPELPGGRVAFYVCPSCGDLDCGAVSGVVERTATQVVWRDFRWDALSDDDGDHLRYRGGPFVFDRAQHDAELRRFVASSRRSTPCARRCPRWRPCTRTLAHVKGRGCSGGGVRVVVTHDPATEGGSLRWVRRG